MDLSRFLGVERLTLPVEFQNAIGAALAVAPYVVIPEGAAGEALAWAEARRKGPSN